MWMCGFPGGFTFATKSNLEILGEAFNVFNRAPVVGSVVPGPPVVGVAVVLTVVVEATVVAAVAETSAGPSALRAMMSSASGSFNSPSA